MWENDAQISGIGIAEKNLEGFGSFLPYSEA
jgi:hypothetical protein